MDRVTIVILTLLAAQWVGALMPAPLAQAQPGGDCVAVAVEAGEDLGRLLDGLGTSYRRVTFDDLKDEALLARLCTLFVGSDMPADAGLEVTTPLAGWVQRGGALYLSGNAYLLLPGVVGAQVTFEADKALPGELTADVVEPGLALALGPRLTLVYEKAGWPVIARTDGQALLQARVRTTAGERTAPLAVQFASGRGAVLYSTFATHGQMTETEQTLAQTLALRLLNAPRVGELLHQRPPLPGAAVQIEALTAPNSTQVFKYATRADQDFDVVLHNPGGRLALSVVSPLTTTAILTPTAGPDLSVVEVRAPAAGEWRVQVRAAQAASQRQPYLLLIIPRIGTNLLNSIRTPLRVSTDPAVWGANLVLAVWLTAVLGLGAALLNSLPPRAEAAEPSSPAARALGTAGQRAAWLYNLVRSPTTWTAPGALRRGALALALAVFFALGALIAAMLDRRFAPTALSGVGLFAGLFVAIGLTSLAFAGGQKLAASAVGEGSALRLRPLGLAGALVLVLLSYILGLLPGFFYALSVGVGLLAVSSQERRRLALPAAAGVIAVLFVGLAFWALSVPTDLALRNLAYGTGSSVGAAGAAALGALQGFFLLVFFVAVQLVFFELLPVGTLSGGYLARWSWVVWGLLELFVSALMLHVLINPAANALEWIGNRSLLALAAGLALYTVAALGWWLARRGTGLARGALVALAAIIGLWAAACACGAIAAAWGTISARLGGG